MGELRINARLDEQTANDLQFLREALGAKSITEVLKVSLRRMAEDHRVRAKAKYQRKLLQESGLIGCIKDGAGDASVNYKKYVAECLDEKYPEQDRSQ